MRVAIYVRVSKKDGRQDTTNQINQLITFAAQQPGWKITKTYQDRVTGKHSNRQAFQDMLADAKAKKFDVLLFWSLDRLTREGALRTLQYLNDLAEWGIGYRSLTEQYLDTCNIFKDAVISILAVIAQQERIRLSERTKAGLARVKAAGLPGPHGFYGPGRPTAVVDKKKLIQLKKSGLTNEAVAACLGVSRATVVRVAAALKKAGTA